MRIHNIEKLVAELLVSLQDRHRMMWAKKDSIKKKVDVFMTRPSPLRLADLPQLIRQNAPFSMKMSSEWSWYLSFLKRKKRDVAPTIAVLPIRDLVLF
jgi:hypothetical protein